MANGLRSVDVRSYLIKSRIGVGSEIGVWEIERTAHAAAHHPLLICSRRVGKSNSWRPLVGARLWLGNIKNAGNRRNCAVLLCAGSDRHGYIFVAQTQVQREVVGYAKI